MEDVIEEDEELECIRRPGFLMCGGLAKKEEKMKNQITLAMIRENILIPIELNSLTVDIPLSDSNQKITEEETDDPQPYGKFKKRLSQYDFECPRVECSKSFLRLSTLVYHMKHCLRTKQVKDLIELVVECPECQEPLTMKSLARHFAKKHLLLNWYFGQIEEGNWAICQNYKCAKYMDQVDDIVEHFRTCKYLWRCKHCFVEFDAEKKVKTHHCCTSSEDENTNSPSLQFKNANAKGVNGVDVNNSIVENVFTKVKKSTCKEPRMEKLPVFNNRPSSYTLNLDRWAEAYNEYCFMCPVEGCNESFYLPWQMVRHLRKNCSKLPSLNDALSIIKVLESKEFSCSISECRQYKVPLKMNSYNAHLKACHLLFFRLLYYLSKSGKTICPNYQCAGIITTREAALHHSQTCKYLWKCQICGAEYQTYQSSRIHLCKKIKKEHDEPLVDAEGNRKKRKSATKAINKLNDIIMEHDLVKGDAVAETVDKDVDNDFDAHSKSSESSLSDSEDDRNYDSSDNNTDIKNECTKINWRDKRSFFTDYTYLDEWLKENTSRGALFTEHMPLKARVLTENQYGEYIPGMLHGQSMKVEYFRNAKSKVTVDCPTKRFHALPALEGSSTLGFNVGGPVWCLAWCPMVPSDEDQILAVTTHKCHSELHSVFEKASEKHLLQFWNVGLLNGKRNHLPYLFLGICHDYGPIYTIKWCPSGCYTTSESCRKRIGLIAVSCADGIVRVLSIPDYSNTERKPVFVTMEPIITMVTHKVDSIEQLKTGMAVSLDWLRVHSHKHVFAGYGDGKLRVWDITTKSIFLRIFHGNGNPALLPFRCIDAHSSAIRTVACCPYNKDIVATGSVDKTVKVFDVNQPYQALYVFRREYPFDIEWMISRIGLLVTSDTCFHIVPGSARYYVFEHIFKDVKTVGNAQNVTTRHNAAVRSCSYNNRLDLVATCDTAGEVMVCRNLDATITKKPIRSKTIVPVYHVIQKRLEEHCRTCHDTKVASDNTDCFSLTNQIEALKGDLLENLKTSSFTFVDSNTFEHVSRGAFTNLVLKRDLNRKKMSTTTLGEVETRSVQKVSWNENNGCHTWLASGMCIGIVRLHSFSNWKQ